MDDMITTLKARLIANFTEVLESGGAQKIADVLMARKNKNVEDDGEQSAQLTFDVRTKIEINNNDFSIVSDLKMVEKVAFTFRAEDNFSLDCEQGELQLEDENSESEEVEEE